MRMNRHFFSSLTSYFKIATLLCLGLILPPALGISKTHAETRPQHFQFERLNKNYENIAPKIKEVQSGPLIIRLSSPEHQLTLHSHGLEIQPVGGNNIHKIKLSAEIEGTGRLLAEIDLLGLRQTIKDRFQIPRQKKQLTGKVRVDRETAGYRITPIKIPKSISIIIQSDLGLQLVLWCKALPLPLLDCADLDRVLSQLTLPLPQDKIFFIKNTDLRPDEQAALDKYLANTQTRPLIK